MWAAATHHQVDHGVAGEAGMAAGKGEAHVLEPLGSHLGCRTGELLDVATRVESVLAAAAILQHGLAELQERRAYIRLAEVYEYKLDFALTV